MRVDRLPASPSRSVLTIGMPPATAASKLSATPLLLGERARASTPCLASSALLAVTTDLAGRERRLDRGLGRIALAPPISSTKTSMPRIARQRDRIVEPAQRLEIDAAVLGPWTRAR